MFDGRGMRMTGRQLSFQFDNLTLHLSILAPLANAFETGFDLAFELQALTSSTDHKRFLHDIATKL
jgi:hypothetical protein